MFSPLVCIAATALAAAPSASGPPTVEALRDEAAALLRIQNTLAWYTQTVGETSIQELTYKGHERLFEPAAIRAVSAALQQKGLDADGRRALLFFKGYLASEAVARAASAYNDEVANAQLKVEVSLPWLTAKVPYKELESLAKNEADAERRAQIERARAAVWRDVLNPILERKESQIQAVAKRLGYRSYVALSEEARMVNLRDLLMQGHEFLTATDALYQPLLAEVAKKELGMEVSQLRRGDIMRLRNAPRFERFFPKELLRESFTHFLGLLGLQLKSANGVDIAVDDVPHPLKEPRASCFSVQVPDDVRITVKPSGGIDDYATYFHEGGHAMHFANATTRRWEFQQLGPNALTEGWAEVFAKAWGDPAWLRHYRAFVAHHNAEHGTKFPTMSDADISELSKARVYNDFYYLRRYAYAKLVYESVLHGGDPALWSSAYSRPTQDPMAVYRDVFAESYGFPMGDEDALRFRTDVDDTFYAADYARAFGLADLVHEALRKKYGGATGDWYANKEVGAALKRLWADGQKLQPDELAREFGEPRLTFGPSEARVRRLLQQASAGGTGGAMGGVSTPARAR